MTPPTIDATLTQEERSAPFRDPGPDAEPLPAGPLRTLTVWNGHTWRDYDPRTRKRIASGTVVLPPVVARGLCDDAEPIIDEEVCA